MVESGIGEGKGGVEGWAGVGLFCRFVCFSSFSSFFSPVNAASEWCRERYIDLKR